MKAAILTFVLMACTWAAGSPGIRPVTRNDRTLPAVAGYGQIYVTARDMTADVDFPSGRSGKGRLFIIFDSSSGFFLETFHWEPNAYPQLFLIDHVGSLYRIGVAPDRLLAVNFAYGVGISESSEKAQNLDDAEAKSLKWIGDHLPDVE